MAKSHHGTKREHTKRKKRRYTTVKSKSSPSIGILSYLRYKSVRTINIGKRIIAITLCLLISLSFLVPVVFSVMQSTQTKHVQKPATQSSNLLSSKDIFIKPLRGFQENSSFEAIKEKLEDILEEIARLKLMEMGVPDVVYLHSRHSSFPTLSDFPEAVAEKLSEEDIAVDLMQAFDLLHTFNSATVYECPVELEEVFCRIVEREAGNQPFLGQLILAEGVVSRVYSGAYGNSSTNSILIKGYSAILEDDGKLHIYNREGKEIITYSENVRNAVRLALHGSRVSHTILQAVTELQNAKYGLQLDDTYFNWGAIYHYSPGGLEERQLRYRGIRRAPVSFQLVDHVFYGYWLPESAQLKL